MTFTYPAIFKQMPDGTYEGHFIDLEGCSARGDNLDLCIRDAIEEMRSWIQVELEEEEVHMPAVTHIDDVIPGEGEIVRNIGAIVRMTDGYDECTGSLRAGRGGGPTWKRDQRAYEKPPAGNSGRRFFICVFTSVIGSSWKILKST